jgi:predicted enzyme related to lactoylglutathione lyase
VSGCVIAGQGYKAAKDGSVVYISAGRDLAEPLARVEGAGGKVLVPKTLINPEIGYFAHFLDSEGNRVGMHSLN